MNSKTRVGYITIATFLFSLSAFAQRGSSGTKPDTTAFTQNAAANTPSTTTSTVYPVGVSQLTTTTTQPIKDQGTIQDWALQAQQRTNKGNILAMVMRGTAFTNMGIACWKKYPDPSCPYWQAAVVGAEVMASQMKSASGRTGSTLAAVTIDPDLAKAYQLNTNEAPTDGDPNSETTSDGKRVKAIVASAEKKGWKVNPKTAKMTHQKTGKVIDGMQVFGSPADLKKSGAPESFVNKVAMAQEKAAELTKKANADLLKKAAEAKTKNADAGEGAFSDDLGGAGGGGGGIKLTLGADGGPGGGMKAANSALGLNRNPAQVAGMKKDFNGNPIGVAGDSIFEMIDRRYELHQKNGSFLEP